MNSVMFILGFISALLVLFLWRAFHLKRFDLSDELLNLSPTDHHWGNLGFWENTQDYQQACRQLARKVGDTAELNPQADLLDVGFGCGDQLILWDTVYHVNSISGVNTSQTQVGLAQKKLRQAGVNAFLHHYDHRAIENQPDRTFSHVLSVDAAYFFEDREAWFTHVHRVLKPEGKLVVTDLVMPDQPSDLLQEFIMRCLLWLCGIPRDNVITLDAYKKQLQEAGFSQVTEEDISASVLDGFAQWLPAYRKQFEGLKDYPIWQKYMATSKFLSWLRKHDLLRCYLISAQR
ncbi:class I SAM-dependent methyltransferase [Litoribrevibacter albus]|uniref:SAM-dependent methyltransferase n=1 Tax=Litoribrevibacter albus TaxID=1473156 RepID=A0AA37W9B1_9GAMM|nr:class I SAM-dependent methyltransferase [Litoribrevibacter albus]GLQ33104.1 SAM-dependent methyltransferase [Litoribrevibacter albus]